MKKETVKRLLNIGFIVLTLAILLYFILSNNEISDITSVFGRLKINWLLACFGALFAYFALDSLGTYLYLRREKQPISYLSAFRTTIIGAYYSNLTPGASGGQPMQVFSMNKNGVPVGVATSALSVKLLFTQLGTVGAALLFWLFNRPFFRSQLGGVKGIILLGITINTIIIPILILAVVNDKLIKKVFDGLLNLLHKIRLVKNLEKGRTKTHAALDSFHQSAGKAFSSLGAIIEQALCGTLQMFFYVSIAYCVYRAFGLNGTPWYHIILVSYMVFLSASYMPLPGGSGAQEGGFYLYYKGIYPEGELGVALLVWRFFTFYLTIILGTLVTIFTSGKKKIAAKTASGVIEKEEQAAE